MIRYSCKETNLKLNNGLWKITNHILPVSIYLAFDNSKNKNMSHYLPWLSLYSFPTFVCPILFSL